MKLDDKMLVLEVGSGSNPWFRSDVLVDRFYVDEIGQRGGGELFVDRRPMIVAAGERLPFKDKSFDFVYCCHVIEHADDIASMLQEMSRVGKAGFIECPNPLLEKVLDQSQHNWYITNLNGKLLIAPKTAESNVTSSADRFYFHMMSDHYIIRNYWEHFVTRLDWKGEVSFEILEDVEQVFSAHATDADIAAIVKRQLEGTLRRAWTDATKESIKGAIRSAPFSGQIESIFRSIRKWKKTHHAPLRIDRERLLELLVCPHCRGELKREDGAYVCLGCKQEFQDVDTVAVLL